MKSTPQTIREAQHALAQFLESERERQSRQSAPADAGASFTVEDEAQHTPTVPAQRAADYAKARNKNHRPLRQMDEADENAREGRDSALAFLERRRRSVIRK
jgi:predicted DsbA family dithiol-disulfide isomerase